MSLVSKMEFPVMPKNQSKLAVERVLCMKGGDGDSSYANNSSLQLETIEAFKSILERSIYENTRVKLKMGEIFRIADFGCGTGRNTVVVANTIVGALQRSLRERYMQPQFQFFFSDLPSNDFNSLFRMLPPLSNDENFVCDNNEMPARQYFAAAVSGSHFGRLFPGKCLHFGHSSSSLHWISRVPESVQEIRSGRVYVSNDCEEGVGDAYLQQFSKDFTAFLNARGREVVEEGCMFIALSGRNTGTKIREEQGGFGYIARIFEYAFEELVNEGIIEEEKWNSFYIPCFGASLEEVESIVKTEGSFEIENIRMVGGTPLYSMKQVNKGEEEIFGNVVANQWRALFETIIEAHLGSEELMHEFFLRIAKRACFHFEEHVNKTMEFIIVVLIKKGEQNISE